MTQTLEAPQNSENANVRRPMMEIATSWGESNSGRKDLEVDIKINDDGSISISEPYERVETLRHQSPIGQVSVLLAQKGTL